MDLRRLLLSRLELHNQTHALICVQSFGVSSRTAERSRLGHRRPIPTKSPVPIRIAGTGRERCASCLLHCRRPCLCSFFFASTDVAAGPPSSLRAARTRLHYVGGRLHRRTASIGFRCRKNLQVVDGCPETKSCNPASRVGTQVVSPKLVYGLPNARRRISPPDCGGQNGSQETTCLAQVLSAKTPVWAVRASGDGSLR